MVVVGNGPGAYPQSGLEQAMKVYEVPVEGGITRLLPVFEGNGKGPIGPVRSARPYIVDLAESQSAVLVHVGGSPLALAMLSSKGAPVDLDGLYNNRLFKRDPARQAPHNDYVNGIQLRRELDRLRLEQSRILRGNFYHPSQDAVPGFSVSIRYAQGYDSSFRYQNGDYLWYRNGQVAHTANGGAVEVSVVVVVHVKAQIVDTEGRLKILLTKGHGAVYIEGRKVPVVWRYTGSSGLLLATPKGDPVNLSPYRRWIMLVPQWAEVH